MVAFESVETRGSSMPNHSGYGSQILLDAIKNTKIYSEFAEDSSSEEVIRFLIDPDNSEFSLGSYQ